MRHPQLYVVPLIGLGLLLVAVLCWVLIARTVRQAAKSGMSGKLNWYQFSLRQLIDL